MSTDVDVAVVGAGIAGLAVAHHLARGGRRPHVFEAEQHVGGRMRTIHRGGYIVDTGAETIGTHGYPATWRLLADLGVTDADVPHLGGPLAMWREGRAHPGVGDNKAAGLSAAARVGVMRLMARAAMRARAYDTDTPERNPLGSTTVAELAGRYHRDVHDYLLQPVTHGLYGWDTTRALAGPLLAHMLAVRATKTLRTFLGGMDSLARALADRVPLTTNVRVDEVAADRVGARLATSIGTITARSVVLAVPAPVAARLHAWAPAYVGACEYQPVVKVMCLLDRPLGGTEATGVLVPRVENPLFGGYTLEHVKNPGRVPVGRGMVTLLAGPATVGGLVGAPEEQAVKVLMTQAERYLPGLAAACRGTIVSRLPHGLPMPTAQALAHRHDFHHRPPGPVDYVGDWYSLRPSAEAAVRSAELVAERLVAASGRRMAVTGV